MKKLGKKISFLTKIMLVVGLLISNLSSLSVVFAYETPDNVRITLEEENNLKIKYTEGTAEEVENLIVNVYETYTYLDSNMEERFAENLKFDTTEDGGLELIQPVSTFNEFDGTYKVVVEIYELIEVSSEPVNELESLDNFTPEVTKVMSEEPIATGTFEKEVTYNSGIDLKVYNNGDNSIINATNDKYVLSENVDEIRVDAYILPGGLAPSDEFLLGDTIYTAEEIQLIPFSSPHLFGDKLYGEYNIPVSVEVEKVAKEENSSEDAEVTEVETDVVLEEESSSDVVDSEETTNNETLKYNTNINVMYGTYNGNTIELNNTLQALDMIDTYTFYGNSKNNTLYKFIDLTEEGNESVTNSMLDLYKTLEAFVNGTSIKYELSKNNEDVIKKYNDTYGVQETPETEIEPASEESEEVVETVSLDDYLKEIALDETVKIVLTSGDVTVSYSLVVLADLNNDGVLDETDVSELIEVVLKEDKNNKKADATGDGVVNSLDILYLTEVIKNSNWAITIPNKDVTLDTELKVNASEEDVIVSGDEFTLDYVLKLSTDEVSGFSGKFNYDNSALELVSIESLIDSVGNYNKENGKFLYLGEESLALPEVEEEPVVPVEPEEEIALLAEGEENLEEPTVVTEDHVVVRAKFRTLKAGRHEVSIKDTEYYNLNTYLNTSVDGVSAMVEVVKSDDNKLSYLEVAGTEIELVDDVFEYEITVKNEVTSVDLKYILSNVAANALETYPEELSEGENEVIITVTSESGIVQDYKVVVTREEAVKETTTQVYYNNYQPNYNEPEVEEPEPVVPVEPEEPKEEKEGNAFNIVIIVLIVLVIGGLVYLIFKDDKEDDDTNKKINKLKKDNSDFEAKPEKQVKENKNSNNNSSKSKNNKSKSNQKNNNKKKEK